jgi:flagellar hook-associated protein 1 FlgK
MTGSILSIGVTALNAASVGLAVTQHNIANVNTPGFHRQTAVYSPQPALNSGGLLIGNGVQVTTVQRVFSNFLDDQVLDAQSLASGASSYLSLVSGLDTLFASESASLSTALSGFFDSLDDLANDPASTAIRETTLSQAQILADTFQLVDGELAALDEQTDAQISASVTLINSYATQIAQLNQSIVTSQAVTGNAPNDLMDQRDQLVAELAKEVDVSVVRGGDGSYSLYIGQGQALVVGSQANALTAAASSSDPQRLSIRISGSSAEIDDFLTGGNLGGALAFRAETLDPTRNQIGLLAIAVSDAVNDQHQLGLDLSGAAGGLFFNAPVLEQPIAGAGNTGTAVLAVDLSNPLSNPSAMTASDYLLSYDGATYTLTRLSDNTTTTFTPPSQVIDDFTLSLTAGAAVAGDTFLIRPTHVAASFMDVALTDPADIAAAAVGGGTTDNANALALGNLRTAALLSSGTATLDGYYGSVVGQVANQTFAQQLASDAYESLLAQARTDQQSLSGVNLDEEAANLIRFQQAFQAAGRALQVANTLFDTILSIGA